MSNIEVKSESKVKPEKVNKEAKYGDDELYESWADNEIFFKLSKIFGFFISPIKFVILAIIFSITSSLILHFFPNSLISG